MIFYGLHTGNFEAASKFCELSCEAVEAIHGPQSAEVTQEIVKLLQLFVQWLAFEMMVRSGRFGCDKGD